jgi:hypothetical protein
MCRLDLVLTTLAAVAGGLRGLVPAGEDAGWIFSESAPTSSSARGLAR